MSSDPFILILGMHRSGTSCLAGCLEACGLFLGEVSRRGRFNAKGNRESKDVWTRHDQILGLNRGSWHNPPDDVVVHPAHLAQLRDIVDRLSSGNHAAGVKDPRILLLLQQWRNLVGPRCRLVGTFRHPMAVAKSLATRNNMPIEQSLNLWVRYNTELVQEHQANPFPLVEYEMTDPVGYCLKVAIIAKQCGLTPNTSSVRRFVSSQLSHHRFSETHVPKRCQQLYDYLRTNARNDQTADVPEAASPTRWSPSLRLRSLFVQASQLPPNSEFTIR